MSRPAHDRRLVAVVVLTLGIGSLDGVTQSLSGGPGTLLVGLQTLPGAIDELSVVPWFAVSAHLYVQGVVDG